MEITVTVKFDGKDPHAEMVKMFGGFLVAQTPAAAVPQSKITVLEPTTLTVASTEAAEVVIADAVEEVIAPVEEKVKRVRRTKVEMEAARNPAPVDQPSDKPYDVAVDPQPVEPKVTFEDAQTALSAAYAKHGMQFSFDLLARYGVKKLRELKPEQLAQFIKEASAA